jgi:hypothetical protein
MARVILNGPERAIRPFLDFSPEELFTWNQGVGKADA